MNKPKKNQVSLSTAMKNKKKSSGLWRNSIIEENGIVIDTTDDAFNGGICINLPKLYK